MGRVVEKLECLGRSHRTRGYIHCWQWNSPCVKAVFDYTSGVVVMTLSRGHRLGEAAEILRQSRHAQSASSLAATALTVPCSDQLCVISKTT